MCRLSTQPVRMEHFHAAHIGLRLLRGAPTTMPTICGWFLLSVQPQHGYHPTHMRDFVALS